MAQFTHDGSFALPERPPFEAGKGPFHVKGGAVLDEIEFHRKRLSPAQFEQAMAHLAAPDFRAYLTQPMSRTGWYDLVPLSYLTASVARVRGVPLSTQLEEQGAWHADQAFRGATGFVLRALSVETLCAWLPRAGKLYHDFGSVEVPASRKGRVRVVRKGIPQFFVKMWATLGAAFLENSLKHAGASDVRVIPVEVTQDGEVSGHKTFNVPVEILWDVAGE
jgi:hypothetical protein